MKSVILSLVVSLFWLSIVSPQPTPAPITPPTSPAPDPTNAPLTPVAPVTPPTAPAPASTTAPVAPVAPVEPPTSPVTPTGAPAPASTTAPVAPVAPVAPPSSPVALTGAPVAASTTAPVAPVAPVAPPTSPITPTTAPIAPPVAGPPPLVIVGIDGSPSSAYPLSKCEGDCNQDSDCEANLLCFQRDAGNAITIPGCTGTTDPNESTDFCFDPLDIPSGTLVIVGNNSVPASLFPLQKCQGDCDFDVDCVGDLVCFQRGEQSTVPGCDGTASIAGVDYCADPADLVTLTPTTTPVPVASIEPSMQPAAPTTAPIAPPVAGPPPLVIVGIDGSPSSAYPLSKCEGDCNQDSDCEANLLCFQRDAGNAITIPGCTGTTDPNESTDFCFDPLDIPSGTLVIVGNNSVPASLFPLQKCQGDCDFDVDCVGDLVCFQRGEQSTVPGCDGTASIAGVDYCADPADLVTPTSSPIPSPVAPPPTGGGSTPPTGGGKMGDKGGKMGDKGGKMGDKGGKMGDKGGKMGDKGGKMDGAPKTKDSGGPKTKDSGGPKTKDSGGPKTKDSGGMASGTGKKNLRYSV